MAMNISKDGGLNNKVYILVINIMKYNKNYQKTRYSYRVTTYCVLYSLKQWILNQSSFTWYEMWYSWLHEDIEIDCVINNWLIAINWLNNILT